LLKASQVAKGLTDWRAGEMRFMPFAAIKDEHYRLYLNVEG